MDLLREHPPAALSLREVARRAGVSHNAPYHHFGDRRQLLKRVAERSMADLLAAQRAASEAAVDPADRLLAVAVAYVEYAARHPHPFSAIYDPEICVPGAPTETMAALIEENEALVARAVGEAWGEADLEARTAGVWAAAHGVATLAVAGHLTAAQARSALRAVLAGAGARHP